jgi:hypothetical protein
LTRVTATGITPSEIRMAAKAKGVSVDESPAKSRNGPAANTEK